MSKKISKTSQLVKALTSGRKLTAKKISEKFNIPNPGATIHYIRNKKNLTVVQDSKLRYHVA